MSTETLKKCCYEVVAVSLGSYISKLSHMLDMLLVFAQIKKYVYS